MRIQLGPSSPFNLDVTLCCGQAFRWDKRAEWWYGVVNKEVFKIGQIGDELDVENVDVEFAKNYFGLHDDLPGIFAQIGKDRTIKQAVRMFRGLRILRQDPWECLISYICATYKNIAAIRQMLSNLSRKFGEKIRFAGYDFYTFPTAQRLAKATAIELAECSLGYRAKYVYETAIAIHEKKLELASLMKMSYEEAKAGLLSLPGVGLKVADCVLLFSLGKLEAFPIDVWIRRAILRHYADHFASEFITKISCKESLSDSEYDRLSLFGREYFGEYAGYAQEYLYHYERTCH